MMNALPHPGPLPKEKALDAAGSIEIVRALSEHRRQASPFAEFSSVTAHRPDPVFFERARKKTTASPSMDSFTPAEGAQPGSSPTPGFTPLTDPTGGGAALGRPWRSDE